MKQNALAAARARERRGITMRSEQGDYVPKARFSTLSEPGLPLMA